MWSRLNISLQLFGNPCPKSEHELSGATLKTRVPRVVRFLRFFVEKTAKVLTTVGSRDEGELGSGKVG